MPLTIADTILVTDEGDEFALVPDGIRRAGGYGRVCKAARIGGGHAAYAVKFMLGRDPSGISPKMFRTLATAEMAGFENEIRHLAQMNRIYGSGEGMREDFVFPFPRYFGRGVKRGTPFYVMEWLNPIDLREMVSDVERIEFVCALCGAVGLLHDNGLVHCDINPSNIMQRPNAEKTARREIVLSDFGSMHVMGDSGREGSSKCFMANTPGYADPFEASPTVNCDIYAIGQVIRAMFGADVPSHWSRIVARCVDANRGYRYPSVSHLCEEVKKTNIFDVPH